MLDSSSQRSLFADWINFLRRPVTTISFERLSFGQKLRRIFQFLSWVFFLIFPLAIVVSLLLKWLKFDGTNAIEQLVAGGNIWQIIFLGSIYAPFSEELLFRLPMVFRPLYISLPFFFLARIILKLFLPNIANSLLYVVLVGLVLVLVAYGFFSRAMIKGFLMSLYSNYFWIVFYSLSLAFSLLHTFNYSNAKSLLLVAFVLTLPQLVVGLALGYIRLKYGFWYSFLFHSLYNSFLLVPIELLKIPGLMTVAIAIYMVVVVMFFYGAVSFVWNLFKYLTD